MPTVWLQNDKFLADLAQDCLRLAGDPVKKIPFSRMDGPLRNGYFSFLYDTQTKDFYNPPNGLMSLPAQVVYLELPNKGELHPLHFAQKFTGRGSEIAEAIHKRSAEEKTARLIPRAKFMGDEFFVDFRKMAFVDTLNWRHEIPFDAAIEAPNKKIFVEYDPNRRNIPDPGSEDFFEDAVALVMLEPYPQLDPDGWKAIQLIAHQHQPAAGKNLPIVMGAVQGEKIQYRQRPGQRPSGGKRSPGRKN